MVGLAALAQFGLLHFHEVAYMGFITELGLGTEAGEGSDGAIIRLRRLVDAHVLHATDLCREYQVAADRLISLEVQAARADRLTGALQSALHVARANLRGRAIAARAAADAMEGAAKALVSYVRGVAESSVPDAAEPEQLLLFATAG